MSEIDFDEIYLDIEDGDIPSGKVKRLPMVSMSEGVALPVSPMYDVREGLEFMTAADGKVLFDFSESSLNAVQQLAIMGYAMKGTKTGASRIAGVPYRLIEQWLEIPEFKAHLDTAMSLVKDTLEEELFRRAMNGSDKLLLSAIKALKPEIYEPKTQEMNINANVVHSWADLAKQAIEARDIIEIDDGEDD